MNTSIVGRKIELTDAIKNYIESAFTQLEKYNLDIIATKAIISTTKKNHKEVSEVEFTVQLAKRDTVVIKQADKDLYAAVDIAIDRVKKVLRRYKDKINNKIHTHVNEKNSDVSIPDIFNGDSEDDELIPADLYFDKPIEIHEALEFLKNSDLMFVVFDDKDNRRRVVYRRKDGNFGIY